MKLLSIIPIAILLSGTLYAQRETYLQQGENTIHLTTYGTGKPLLIINGGPGMSSEGFKPLAKKLSQKHQTILYDQRGTGQSTLNKTNTQTITMDSMVNDIELIRKHFKFDTWIVMGHSFGGMLASYYAAKYPDKIDGLILSSSGGINMDAFATISITDRLSTNDRDSLNYWSNQIAQGDTSYHARYQRGMYLAPAYLYDKTNVPIVAERLTQGDMNINRLVWQDLNRINFDCTEGLKHVKVNVLIIQGKEDIIDLATAKTAQRAFPNSKLVLLDDCSHYGWLDQPVQYYEAINSYLSELN